VQYVYCNGIIIASFNN